MSVSVVGKAYFRETIGKIVKKRKSQPTHQREELMLDMIIGYTDDEEQQVSDALIFTVGGFHTTGNCKLQYLQQSFRARPSLNVPSDMCAQHSRSLIRIFTGRISGSPGGSVSSCRQRRLDLIRLQWMRRLIEVFVVRSCQEVRFLPMRLIC